MHSKRLRRPPSPLVAIGFAIIVTFAIAPTQGGAAPGGALLAQLPGGGAAMDEGVADLAGPLRELVQTRSRAPLQVNAVAASRGLEVYGDMVKALILFKNPAAADRAAVRALGVQPQIRRDRRLQALIPIANLPRVAALPEVAMVRPPRYLIPLQVPSRGSVITEAWQFINASSFDLVSPPIYGAGTTVTVIDQEFLDYAARQASFDLPPDPDTTYTEFSTTVPPPAQSGPHGTAVAEIVHDLAPGAMINLYRAITDMEIESAVNAVGMSGVDVAVMSLGLVEGPFDGSSSLSQAVNSAASHGVFFAVSSGNFAQRHWEGWFKDTDKDGLNEFAPANEAINLTISGATTGNFVRAYLSWWKTGAPLTAQDYDLVLRDANGQQVARSAFTQDGDDEPVEVLIATVPDGQYQLEVEAVNINPDLLDYLELYVWNADLEPALQIASSSLSVPADAAGAVTVGATRGVNGLPDGLTIDSLEPFSSQGPTDDGRLKPEIVAPDAITTASGAPAFAPFYGTSAAAPHVAGAAALLMSEDPSRNSADVLLLLQRLAIDMGTPGWDNQFGEGRIALRVGVTGLPPADQIPPIIAIVSPTPGQLLGTRRPRIVASLDDEESGIDPATIELKIDGVLQIVDPGDYDPLAEILEWTVPSDLSLGAHIITLTAADNDGNQGNTATVGFRIALPNIEAGLRMFSLPLTNLTDPDPVAIFGMPLSNVALARWLPEDTAYNKYHVFPDPFAGFEPPDAEAGYPFGQTVPTPPAGLAYFLRLTNDVTLDLGAIGQPADTSQPYVIRLRRGVTNPKGWNMIGTPFNAPIELATVQFLVDGVPMTLGDVIDEGYTTGILFTFVPDAAGGGHYEFSDPMTGRLDPLVGYWLQVRRDMQMQVFPVTPSSSPGKAKALSVGAPDWRIKLSAQSGGHTDPVNFAGVAQRAVAGPDAGDIAEPPPISTAVNLYFPHPDWGDESGNYVQDLRSADAASQQWRFEVDSSVANEDVVLSWDLMDAPKTKVFVLRDLDAGEQVFMRTQSSYVFRTGASGGTRHFELVAGDRVAGALKVVDLQVLPLRGGGSEVSFSLSVPAEVTADLLNVAGVRIRRLADRSAASAGRSSLVWDGRNQAGMMVPNGAYICRLVAQTTEDHQQASLMRQFFVGR